jgi:hypothetical protein
MLIAFALLLAPVGGAPAACSFGPGWGTGPLAMRTKNFIRRQDGVMVFNGALVSDDVLRQYFRSMARTSPRPWLVVDTTDMGCADKQRILAHAEAAGGCTPEVCSAYPMGRRIPPPAPRPGGRWP